MNRFCRLSVRDGTLGHNGKRTLAVHLDKVHARIFEKSMPLVPETEDRVCLRLYRDLSIGIGCKKSRILFLCLRSRKDSIPVSLYGLPYADIFHLVGFFQHADRLFNASRKLYRVRLKAFQHLTFGIRPAVIDQHPLNRHFLFFQLFHLINDGIHIYALTKRIPGTPAQFSEDFRKFLLSAKL